MKKKETQKEKAKTANNVRSAQPWLKQLRGLLDWGLDIVAHLARGIEEDVDAVERTRSYVHAWIDGRPIDVDMRDVSTTVGVLFAAIDIELAIDSSPILASLAICRRMVHLPGAAHDDEPTVVTHTPELRRRNSACGPFIKLAA